jgi:hypothetical protein
MKALVRVKGGYDVLFSLLSSLVQQTSTSVSYLSHSHARCVFPYCHT